MGNRVRLCQLEFSLIVYFFEVYSMKHITAQLINKAVDFLCSRRFNSKEEAEKTSREFIEFFKGRAWVFTDVGTILLIKLFWSTLRRFT
ncbi:MAG: hypothetical protein ACFFBD_17280 [Candidatus Hodarchaeota archaeon]